MSAAFTYRQKWISAIMVIRPVFPDLVIHSLDDNLLVYKPSDFIISHSKNTYQQTSKHSISYHALKITACYCKSFQKFEGWFPYAPRITKVNRVIVIT